MKDNKANKWGKIAEEAASEEIAESLLEAEEELLDEEEPAEESAAFEKPEVLREKIASLEHALNESQQKMLRVMAEADNMQRRAKLDVESAHKYALEKFARELLPVIDSLERAVAFDPNSTEEKKSADQGVVLTMQLFEKVCEKFGMKALNPVAEAFNPAFHEAVTMQPSQTIAENHVVTVIQKGYLLNERLLRAAMVVVSKGPA